MLINLIVLFCFDIRLGNGPSGITLSYMLAGNWPHWKEEDISKHPDELLSARLSCADSNKSLVEQDLVQLAEGLEGRSTNPVSLLVKQNATFFFYFCKTFDNNILAHIVGAYFHAFSTYKSSFF